MLKILFWDGNGLCLFTKRLYQGSFVWPVMASFDGSITLTPAQLAMLIEGLCGFQRSHLVQMPDGPNVPLSGGFRVPTAKRIYVRTMG